jgi:hypothetical protein
MRTDFGRVNLILHGLMAVVKKEDDWRILVPEGQGMHETLFGNPSMQCTMGDVSPGVRCLHHLERGKYEIQFNGVSKKDAPGLGTDTLILNGSKVVLRPKDAKYLLADIAVPTPHLVRTFRAAEISVDVLKGSPSEQVIVHRPAVLSEVIVLSYFGEPRHPMFKSVKGKFSYPIPKTGDNVWNFCLYSEPLTVPDVKDDHTHVLTDMFKISTIGPAGPVYVPLDFKLRTAHGIDRPAATAWNVGISGEELMTLVDLQLPGGSIQTVQARSGNNICGEPGGCGPAFIES